MTLYGCNVQTYCSLAHDIKRNQCRFWQLRGNKVGMLPGVEKLFFRWGLCFRHGKVCRKKVLHPVECNRAIHWMIAFLVFIYC